MATYLLTWNPDRDDTPDLDWARELEAKSERGETVEFSWSCGRTKSIEHGDRAVFLRQGLAPRGVLAVGRVVRGPREAEHWKREADAQTVQMVEVRWAHFAAEPVVPRERLNEPPFDSAHWDARGSGVSVSEGAADALMDEFWEAAGLRWDPLPDEEAGGAGSGIAEGAPTTGTASRYERSAKAREACLVAHGTTCKVCDVGMKERYGPAAEGLIHVHHLEPLASVGEEHRVDPVRDLRPVCPNCHAVIHYERPPSSPRTLEKVRCMLAAVDE